MNHYCSINHQLVKLSGVKREVTQTGKIGFRTRGGGVRLRTQYIWNTNTANAHPHTISCNIWFPWAGQISQMGSMEKCLKCVNGVWMPPQSIQISKLLSGSNIKLWISRQTNITIFLLTWGEKREKEKN